MRPYQWVKNSFCFAGVAFGKYYSIFYLSNAAMVFIAFCFASSGVYVLNDIVDAPADRLHPKKKNRPLASGGLSLKFAKALYVFCVIVALSISFKISIWAFYFIFSYIILNILYTFKLKHIVILDVFIISLGFLFRLFSGTTGLGIVNSDWLVLCATMITLLLGFAKRRSELLLCENMQIDPYVRRRVLEDYEPKMLDIFISVTAACSLLSYFLFIIFTNKVNLLTTAFFVTYGIFRYIFKLYKHGGGQDTANDLLDDPHLIITGIIWVVLYIFLNW
jgi:4-hydroxybenzoate polyprenyltransferase